MFIGSDTESETFPMADFAVGSNGFCDIDLNLVRFRNGNLDGTFDDGFIVARQERDITVHLN